ncbi:MAG TPA: PliI family lysozyme inhibitor of I-type lysozyme [Povalibacter sp.]|nr:PliI family lysozyme inhibitor of I-type lysozyme [Povalibacter sp.]
MNRPAALFSGLLATAAVHGADAPGHIRKAMIPDHRHTVVVAAGELEPASVGSYSLRVYAAINPAFPYDDFVTGVVRQRDGTIEDIRFVDLDHDGSPEIIVIMRSAGSGGYLAADAFRFKSEMLTLLASVSGLPADADAVRILGAQSNEHAAPASAQRP